MLSDPSFAAHSSREQISRTSSAPEGRTFQPAPPPVVLPDAPNTHAAHLFLDRPGPAERGKSNSKNIFISYRKVHNIFYYNSLKPNTIKIKTLMDRQMPVKT